MARLIEAMADNSDSIPGVGKVRNSATPTSTNERNARPRMRCQKRSDLPLPPARVRPPRASGCMFESTAPLIIPRGFIERSIIEHANLVLCYNNLRVCERPQTYNLRYLSSTASFSAFGFSICLSIGSTSLQTSFGTFFCCSGVSISPSNSSLPLLSWAVRRFFGLATIT